MLKCQKSNTERGYERKITVRLSLPARLASPRGGTAAPASAGVLEALASVDAVEIEGVALVACLPGGAFGPALGRADGGEALTAGLVLERVVDGLLLLGLTAFCVDLLGVDLFVVFGGEGGSSNGLFVGL
jgi:hypothetical protein